VDLNPLKIDRGESAVRKSRRRSGAPIGWAVFLIVVGAALYLFRKPLLGLVDRVSLPEVSAVMVSKSSPLAASAVSGTAANGYIVASKRAALSADTPGRIVEMNVIEGSVVKKGQIVARLYADEYSAALRRAEADLQAQHKAVERARAQADAARADLARLEAEVKRSTANVGEQQATLELARVKEQRAEKMLAENIWTQQALDDARTERVRAESALAASNAAQAAADAALAQGRTQVTASEALVNELQARIAVIEAERDQAKATLDKTEVRAPFDGIVVLKDAEVGEVVSPNSQGGNSRGSMATMVDWSSLEVQVELQETSLAAAVVGEAASIYLDAYPDVTYRGKVLRIWPTANRTKATVEVRVGFDAPDERLRPEMGARVVFGTSKEPAAAAEQAEPSILISRKSVVRIDGADGVFVLERDVVRFRAIELGDERGDRVRVDNGLTSGERIVAAPPTSLQDGDRVRIKE
jgi:RND family efflux transporter MFP subunit